MLKFLRKHDRKLMAVFGVFLMISFVATLGPTKCNNDPYRNQDALLTTVNGREIRQHDVTRASAEWDVLRRVVVQGGQPGAPQWQPVASPILGQINPNLPMFFAQQLRDNPEMYALLQAEAQQLAVAPQFVDADGLLTAPSVAIELEDGRIVPFADINDVTRKQQIRQATANFLMVVTAFRRPLDAIKISTPMVRVNLGQQFQQLKLRIADFPVKDFEAQVGTPTDEQLKAHFDKYADTIADAAPSATNPFGFGYRYPNRVKLQYISIPRAEVRKAIQAAKSEYDWSVDANKYYLQHQVEFISTTKPAATQESFSLSPTTQAAPTTQPFAAVREQILNRLIDPLVDRLTSQIQNELTARLNGDFEKYRAAGATTAPSTLPGSGWSVNFEYFQTIAQDVLNRHKVTLTVASVADSFKAAADLAALPGIGTVSGFTTTATEDAEAFVPEDRKQASTTLSLYKPSKPLFDDSRNVYFFRLTAAEPAHKPTALDEVREKVETDWKRQQAFEKAKAEAQKLVDNAKNDPSGLGSGTPERKVSTVGPLSLDPNTPIEGYSVSQRGQTDLLRQASQLLTDLARRKSTTQPGATTAPSGPPEAGPMAVVELPADARICVIELIAVDSRLDPQSIEGLASLFADQISQPFHMSVIVNWFNFDSIAERTGYTPDASRPRRAARASAG